MRSELEQSFKVSPAMIEAGADVLAGFDLTFADERIWAARVFETMRRAASPSLQSASYSEPDLA